MCWLHFKHREEVLCIDPCIYCHPHTVQHHITFTQTNIFLTMPVLTPKRTTQHTHTNMNPLHTYHTTHHHIHSPYQITAHTHTHTHTHTHMHTHAHTHKLPNKQPLTTHTYMQYHTTVTTPHYTYIHVPDHNTPHTQTNNP